MQETIKKLITKLLRETADKIDAGTCELTDEEATDITKILSHRALSKEQAKYIKDVIDDIDAEEGYIFNRFYADTVFMNNPIEWEDMI